MKLRYHEIKHSHAAPPPDKELCSRPEVAFDWKISLRESPKSNISDPVGLFDNLNRISGCHTCQASVKLLVDANFFS